MDNMYLRQREPQLTSPNSFLSVPELMSSSYDDETDQSPSPSITYSNFEGQEYTTWPSPTLTNPSQNGQPQPVIVNSIEFTDLTRIQHEDRLRWQHRDKTNLDREATSNMRIRRRAQNRASQRAFRERKEKRVQHLEQELEQLESKHRDLQTNYSNLDSRHSKLKQEVTQLRCELDLLGVYRGATGIKHEQTNLFDPFANNGLLITGTAGSNLGF